jgi:hypothetical protein
VAQRLHEIETVPTVTPGAQGRYGATGIPIETAVAEGARFSYSLDGEAIARLVGLLYELQQDAPLTLREPIVMYIQALDKLLRGEKRFFGWRIRRARSAFQHALDHQRRIDSYTDQVADSAIPWQERLAPYLEVLRADDERWRRVWPDLHAYLDGLPTAASDPAEQRTAMPAPAWVRP